MKLITSVNAAEYLNWYNRARMDQTVWPWLAFVQYTDPRKIMDEDWNSLTVMSDDNRCACSVSIQRSSPITASIAVWCLDAPGGAHRALVVGRFMRELLLYGKRYGIMYAEASCHESNVASRKLLTRLFGAPWGIEPNGAWNGLTSKFEGRCVFQTEYSSLLKRVERS